MPLVIIKLKYNVNVRRNWKILNTEIKILDDYKHKKADWKFAVTNHNTAELRKRPYSQLMAMVLMITQHLASQSTTLYEVCSWKLFNWYNFQKQCLRSVRLWLYIAGRPKQLWNYKHSHSQHFTRQRHAGRLRTRNNDTRYVDKTGFLQAVVSHMTTQPFPRQLNHLHCPFSRQWIIDRLFYMKSHRTPNDCCDNAPLAGRATIWNNLLPLSPQQLLQKRSVTLTCYSRSQPPFFFFLLASAARVAVSKTWRTPSFVLAEHSM